MKTLDEINLEFIQENLVFEEEPKPPAQNPPAPEPVTWDYEAAFYEEETEIWEEAEPPVQYLDQPDESIITDEQLRALSRKHLLMMIRDLEKELLQAKKERDRLLIAYEAGLMDKKKRLTS